LDANSAGFNAGFRRVEADGELVVVAGVGMDDVSVPTGAGVDELA
jgi:hypothetical protein